VIQSRTLAKALTSDIGFPSGPAKGHTFERKRKEKRRFSGQFLV
jgi:hypothetical protein